jgi:hypothetical protein
MATQQDVTDAWKSVEKAAEELRAHLKAGAFYSDRKVFDELVEKQKQAFDVYVRALTELVNESR